MRPNFTTEGRNRSHELIGVDETGSYHHIAEHESRIIVIDADGTLEHVEHIDSSRQDQITTEWIVHIAKERGWDTRVYMPATEFFATPGSAVDRLGKGDFGNPEIDLEDIRPEHPVMAP